MHVDHLFEESKNEQTQATYTDNSWFFVIECLWSTMMNSEAIRWNKCTNTKVTTLNKHMLAFFMLFWWNLVVTHKVIFCS